MTTLIMSDADYSPAGIRRRIKEEFARHGIESETEAAERYGRPQQWLSRRITGETDWKLSELENFCRALGISYAYIATGIRELPVPPPNPPAAPAAPFSGPQAGGARVHQFRPRAGSGIVRRSDRELTTVQDGDVDEDAARYVALAEGAPTASAPTADKSS